MASPSVREGTLRKNPQSPREKGAECEFFGVVNTGFLFGNVQVKSCLQEARYLLKDFLCLLSTADESDEVIVGVADIEESSIEWVERVACR